MQIQLEVYIALTIRKKKNIVNIFFKSGHFEERFVLGTFHCIYVRSFYLLFLMQLHRTNEDARRY